VDWNGAVQQGAELIKANRVTDFLGARHDQRSLAEKTGLTVKGKRQIKHTAASRRSNGEDHFPVVVAFA
jgi:hypothetical protein